MVELLRHPSLTLLAPFIIGALLLGGCESAPPAPAKAEQKKKSDVKATPLPEDAARQQAYQEAFKTPVPTPVPMDIVGKVVIKLERGADLAAGIQVRLLDAGELQSLTLTRTALMKGNYEAELEELDRDEERLTEQAKELMEQTHNLELELNDNWNQILAEGLEELEDNKPRVVNVAQGLQVWQTTAPDAPEENMTEAWNRLNQHWNGLRPLIERMDAKAESSRKEAGERLQQERELFESTYRHKPDMAEASQLRTREYNADLNYNPFEFMAEQLTKFRDGNTSRVADHLLVMGEEIQRIDQHRDEVALRKSELRREIEDTRVAVLESILDGAQVDDYYADDQARFRFRVAPAEYYLYAEYADPVSGASFVWLRPARGDTENNLTTFNTVAQVGTEDVPGFEKLIKESQQ
jgi:hypothetical protein